MRAEVPAAFGWALGARGGSRFGILSGDLFGAGEECLGVPCCENFLQDATTYGMDYGKFHSVQKSWPKRPDGL